MARFVKKSTAVVGLPPGTPIHIGERKSERVRITVIDYTEKEFEERQIAAPEDSFSFKDSPSVTWINIDGLHDIEVIETVCRHFGIHPLIMEDIVNTGQRPKVEDLGDYVFIVVKMLDYDERTKRIDAEQVSLILARNLVISFQERVGDIFDPIRARLRNGKGRIRRMGADYLAYTLLDCVVDNYFLILERMSDKIEGLEEKLVKYPTADTLLVIHVMKRELLFLRKSVWPLREGINTLQKIDSTLIAGTTGIYLRDVYDHTIQVIDTVETLRDMVSGMLETYLSSLSNKMNEVMKVLTVIATTFIPLTLIAGIYGMNFQHMPELKWRWAYPAVWGVMVIVFFSMMKYFKRRKWM